MLRTKTFWAGLVITIAQGVIAYSQTINPNTMPGPIGTAGGIRPNTFQAGKYVAVGKQIVQPIPLNATEKDSALEGMHDTPVKKSPS